MATQRAINVPRIEELYVKNCRALKRPSENINLVSGIVFRLYPASCLLLLPQNFPLDPTDMPAAGALDLAAQLEIAPDLDVVQDAETIHDGRRPSDPLHHLIGIETQVRLVPHGQDHGVRPLKSLGQVLGHRHR